MKSSTIRRSTLSKESIEVIENLAKEQEAEGLGEYVRPDEVVAEENRFDFANKTQEIDLLWQNFKNTQFNSNSPTAYILLGFGIGVLVSAIVGTLIAAAALKSHYGTADFSRMFAKSAIEQPIEKTPIINTEVNQDETSTPIDEQQVTEEQTHVATEFGKTEKYIVKEGDTGEYIIKHYYGSFSPEKAELIMKVNNLDNLDRLHIDQELLIPIEQ